MSFTDLRAKLWMKKYLRFVDYLGVAQLYLKDNFQLTEPLVPEHIKDRVLGHWGTVPGLNFIYANLNYLVWKHKCEVMLITGPGHGAPAILANLFMEGTLKEFYPQFTVDAKGMGQMIKDFSWPFSPFPSHVTPSVPGSILEGGELGYSLSTAFGAAFDNKDLIVACVVGDGEAESGPLAAAWHSNKFLNPRHSGAVLPILHVNGYKISNPTIYGTMDDKEIRDLFSGFGYNVKIVDENHLESKMINAMEESYREIKKIQEKARKKGIVLKVKWPMIVLRSPKGWHGIHNYKGKAIEGSFRAHGVPLEDVKKGEGFEALKNWLSKYKINELLEKDGKPKQSLFKFIVQGDKRIGMNKHVLGGNMMKKISLPNLAKYASKIKKRGQLGEANMRNAAKYIRDIFKATEKDRNFRFFCPDEIESNQLHGIFEATKRAYVWPIPQNAENVHPDGRAMEILSEHNLQGWMQGYLLTGRYGMFCSYEAFTMIIASMVDQFAKFLKQASRVKWRKPIPSAIYIQSSVGWRQEHNGYSHQNPGFVSNVLEKHGEFSQVFYPSDSNSLLVALEESMKRKNGINVIVADKRNTIEWLSLAEARKQAKTGIGIWDWASSREAAKIPDVVLASAGDYMTVEAMMAIKICKELIPEMKIRYVNVSEISGLCVGDYGNNYSPKKLSQEAFYKYFTKDKPVVFNYHGYTNDVEQILWRYADGHRFSVHGYSEEGSTTTPFDMAIRNKVSRYHLAMDLIEKASVKNKKIAQQKRKLINYLEKKVSDHHEYIIKYADDPKEVKELKW